MWELGFLEVSVRLSNEFRWAAEGEESDVAAVRLSLAMRRELMEKCGFCGW